MVNPFEPLASLVALAVSRYGRLYATSPGPGGGHRAASVPVVSLSRHDLEPVVVYADEPWQASYAPFEIRPLYKVAWRDSTGVIWIGRNCHAPAMPPPPTAEGPAVCACPDAVTGERIGRYGWLTRTWAFEPNQYTDAAFYEPFTPDVLAGAGTCAAREEPGFFTQWDPTWVERGEDEMLVWTHRFRNETDNIEETDAIVNQVLGLAHLSQNPIQHSARSEEAMRTSWASYVALVLHRRARATQLLVTRHRWMQVQREHPAAWATIRSAGYFRPGALGAWFKDANTYARRFKIMELLRAGVPVFYRWSPNLEVAEPWLALPEEARFLLDDMGDYPQIVRAAPARMEQTASSSGAGPNHDPAPPYSAASSSTVDRSGDSFTDPIDEHTWRLIGDDLVDLDETNARPANEAPSSEETSDEDPVDEPMLPEDLVRASASNSNGESTDEEPLEYTVPVAPAEPPIEFPTEGHHFLFTHGSHLASRFEGGVRTIPCKRVDNQVKLLVQDDTAFLMELAPPRSRVYAGDDNTENVDVHEDSGAVAIVPTLIIYDDGLARRVLNHAFEKGAVTGVAQLVEFLIENGMRFATGVGLTGPKPTLTQPLHAVGRDFWYDELAPLKMRYARWELSILALARRPHFAKAALARGGIIALALRHFIEPQFGLRPTLPTLRFGSPVPINVDGRVFHDDWLSEEEENLLLGYPKVDAQRSLLPPAVVFNRFYAGVLTPKIEEWFALRMRELKFGVRPTTGAAAKTALGTGEWKHVLRDASRTWYN